MFNWTLLLLALQSTQASSTTNNLTAIFPSQDAQVEVIESKQKQRSLEELTISYDVYLEKWIKTKCGHAYLHFDGKQAVLELTVGIAPKKLHIKLECDYINKIYRENGKQYKYTEFCPLSALTHFISLVQNETPINVEYNMIVDGEHKTIYVKKIKEEYNKITYRITAKQNGRQVMIIPYIREMEIEFLHIPALGNIPYSLAVKNNINVTADASNIEAWKIKIKN